MRTQYEAQRLQIVGAISELPPEEQALIDEAEKTIREAANKDEFGMLAFALVALEIARDTEDC